MSNLDTIPLVIDQQMLFPAGAQTETTYSASLDTDYVRYVSARPEDAIAAVESSWKAFQSWSQTKPRHRRDIMLKTAALIRENGPELRKLCIEEVNCTDSFADINLEWSARHLEEMAGRITTVLQGEIPIVQTDGQMGFVFKKPIGPVLSIPPWNAPLFLATRVMDLPLAVGCTVVLKASEKCPRVHHRLAQLFQEAGLPKGVLNVIQARREDAQYVTEALIAHPNIRLVEFIGSKAVGSKMAEFAGKHLKPLVLELGGKSAAVVLDDADLELSAKAAIRGAFSNAGQACLSTERVVVLRSVSEELIRLMVKEAKEFPVSGAISREGPARFQRMLREAVDKGAKLHYGSLELNDPVKSQGVILGGVTADMEIWDEEAFAPCTSVYVVDSEEEAIEVANSSQYGLTAAVYSKDINRAMSVALRLDVGQTHINFPFGTGSDEATLPVGIAKASGHARQNGNYGLDIFLTLGTITISSPDKVTSII